MNQTNGMVRAFTDPVLGAVAPPRVFSRAECRTLADVIARVPLEVEAVRPHLRIVIAGEIIDPALYHRILPKPGTALTVVLPLGDDGNILGTIAAVALLAASVVVSAGLAAPFLGTAFAAGSIGANLLSAGLSLGATLLLQGLAAPKASAAAETEDIGTASANNAFQPGAYLPRVLGARRMAPPMVMPPYTEVIGRDQYVTAVYGLAGPHAISDIRIGDSAIEDADDVEYEIREGFAGDAALTLVTETVIEKAINLTLSEFRTKTAGASGYGLQLDTTNPGYVPGWHRVETGRGPDKVKLLLAMPQGLGSTVQDQYRITSMRIRIRRKGTPTWTNLPEVLLRGNAPGSPMRLQVTFRWVASGSMPGSSTIFPGNAGGPAFTNKSRGFWRRINRWPASGTAQWRASTYFTSTQPNAITWLNGLAFDVYLDTTTFPQDEPYEIELIRGFPGAWDSGHYDISTDTYSGYADFYTPKTSGSDLVIPIDPDNVTATITLTAVQSIWSEYPFDFTDQPTALLAIRARNRNIDQLTALFEGYCESWDGSDWIADQLSRNPADWYREVLRGPLNAEPVPDSLIDMAMLADWAEWCGPGRECNTVVTGQPITDVLSAIAQAGFARPRFGATHSVVIDRPRDVVGLVTQRNAAGFSFEKPFGRLPHALKVQLEDETDDYAERELIVYADGYGAVAGGGLEEATRFESVKYPAITSASQATARAERDMRFARHRSRLINFSMDIEHLGFSIGDRVLLETDILGQMGGRGRVAEILTSGGLVTGLRFDEERDFTAADAAAVPRGIALRLVDGTVLTKGVTADDSDLAAVTFSTPFAMPTDGAPMTPRDLIEVGTLVATGTLGQEARDVLIWDMAPGADLTCQVVAIDYAADEIYEQPALLGARGTAVASSTSASINMATDVAEGELLLVLFTTATGRTVTLNTAGYTEITPEVSSGSGGTGRQLHLYRKIADGSEGALSFTLSGSAASAGIVMRVSAPAGSIVKADAVGTGIAPDPAGVTLSGMETTLIIEAVAGRSTTVPAASSGYTSAATALTSNMALQVATKLADTDSENPGALGNMAVADVWAAMTLAVR